MDDHAFYWTQLLAFKAEYGNASGVISDLIRLNELDKAELLAHTLKGTAGMLGLEKVQDASARLNASLKSACATGVVPPQAIGELDQVRQALDLFCAGIASLSDRMKAS